VVKSAPSNTPDGHTCPANGEITKSPKRTRRNREGIQMTITRLILLVMAVFLVVFAIRFFGSRFLNR
jgi:preprotein translocase subunit SecF